MKRVLFVMFVLVIVSSFAFGQQDATIIQGGAAAQTNTATSDQSGGSGNLIFIQQIINHGTATADNTANLKQVGIGNIARLNQLAGSTGISGVGASWQPYNIAKIDQLGNNNKLVGATNAGQIDEGANARQNSGNSYNTLTVWQQGLGNRIGLNQISGAWNKVADLDQIGNYNFFVIHQQAGGGSEVDGEQAAAGQQEGHYNVARISQYSRSYSNANIVQYGDYNRIAGADTDGSIKRLDASYQSNVDGAGNHRNNSLTVKQYGGDNVVGLYQFRSASGLGLSNTANITQNNGFNSFGAYQTTTGANYNKLNVTQNGGDVAKMVQTGAGENSADIWMGGNARATLSQTGGVGNTIDINMGLGATLTATQIATTGTNYLFGNQSAGSTALVNQIGVSNSANINQY